MKNISWKQGLLLGALFVGLFSFNACKSDSATTNNSNQETKTYENKVINNMSVEPAMLTPYNAVDAAGRFLGRRVFQPLLFLDFFNYELVPVLAKERPKIVEKEDGTVEMTFEIRDEATWDDGSKITANDVAFSLKVTNTPGVDNAAFRPYFEYIKDIVIDKENDKKFTFICDKAYMLMESALTDLPIIPASTYDPEGILKGYSLKHLTTGGPVVEKDEKLAKYAEFFNSPAFQREIMAGSGPYEFDRWETNQRLVFKLKKDWYGHKLKNENHWFDANVDELVYEVINDATTAVVALKSEKIDVINRVDPRVFMTELKTSEDFNEKFNTHTPTQFLYSYMGMNMRSPLFEDVKTRRAIRHIMNIEKYDETVFYGLSERVTSFIHPSKKEFINTDLKLVPYDLAKGAELLAEAGWKDSNGNGTLDKEVEGELVEFKVEYIYPNIAKTSEKAVLMFKESARKVGIEIEALPTEYSVFLDKTKEHDFDMYFGIWQSSPLESDPKQIWHTSSFNGGSNFVGFGTPRSDEVIEKLRSELDRKTRIGYYKELQQIIDDEAPYVFLSAYKNRVAIHKKYSNAKSTGMNPGYYVPGFQVQGVEVSN